MQRKLSFRTNAARSLVLGRQVNPAREITEDGKQTSLGPPVTETIYTHVINEDGKRSLGRNGTNRKTAFAFR